MKTTCTHYQGQCDHIVCPRDAARQAAEKAEIDGWLADLPDGTVLELPPPPYVPRSEITFTVRRKPLDPR